VVGRSGRKTRDRTDAKHCLPLPPVNVPRSSYCCASPCFSWPQDRVGVRRHHEADPCQEIVRALEGSMIPILYGSPVPDR